jgi:hypothetical protein
MEHSDRTLLIHYSCESFYDRADGSSPRVTSIAVRHLDTRQTHSFSIHLMAEREHSEIERDYDGLERKMLDEFYEYVRTHPDCYWLHWNMRDVNYGFQAIDHRYRVLGGCPTVVPDEHRVDLSEIVGDINGRDYVQQPHLANLMRRNRITDRDFLMGADEAKAFEDREYVAMHRSTLRKVHVLHRIAELADEGKLQTDATWRDRYGLHPQALAEWLSEHWLGTIVGFTSSAIGILIFLGSLVRWLTTLW